jgi:hypothetical protein
MKVALLHLSGDCNSNQEVLSDTGDFWRIMPHFSQYSGRMKHCSIQSLTEKVLWRTKANYGTLGSAVIPQLVGSSFNLHTFVC